MSRRRRAALLLGLALVLGGLAASDVSRREAALRDQITRLLQFVAETPLAIVQGQQRRARAFSARAATIRADTRQRLGIVEGLLATRTRGAIESPTQRSRKPEPDASAPRPSSPTSRLGTPDAPRPTAQRWRSRSSASARPISASEGRSRRSRSPTRSHFNTATPW